MARTGEQFNPFYALVILIATAFVLSTLAFVVVVCTPRSGAAIASRGSEHPVRQFLERRGESLLLGEAAALGLSAGLAMALDRWRSWRHRRLPPAHSGETPS